METAHISAPAAVLAKGALKRLALAQQEPTPENYARAYAEESGQAPPVAAPATTGAPSGAAAGAARPSGAEWAQLVQRLARNLDRGGKQWTSARRKDSLQRVLDGSRSDEARLLQRLQALMGAWEDDQPSDPARTGAEDPPLIQSPAQPSSLMPLGADPASQEWPPLVAALESTVRAALPPDLPAAAELAAQLSELAEAVSRQGATPKHVKAIAAVCDEAQRLLGQGHRLVNALGGLCRELSAGLSDLAEDDSWTQGQCARLQEELSGALQLRGLKSAAALLAQTRIRQARVREGRRAAQGALRQHIHDMLLEVGELGEHTGRFQQAAMTHAQAIGQAESLESLAGVVKALLDDTRTVQTAVSRSQQKLLADRDQAALLQERVRELESELRRLSDEVSTDLLTQVANRRGLMSAFDAERARSQRQGDSALAVGLIDIDNFKKLNDTLGHAAGDQALKALAAGVRERLRPQDHLARFGGEEFVVLLPGSHVEEARQALTRLQRSLSEALFLHEGREVFVTFSAGVTAWRTGEDLQPALERADQALYEAKRTGKNRTCSG
jgi:diguanylate cyclase